MFDISDMKANTMVFHLIIRLLARIKNLETNIHIYGFAEMG